METPKKIIIVDDDYGNNLICRIVITRTLQDVQISDFHNPLDFLDYIKKEFSESPEPTIVLLDINLGEMSGWEVLEELTKLPSSLVSHLKIFLLSSSVDRKDLERANNDPRITAYLTKPLLGPKLEDIYEAL